MTAHSKRCKLCRFAEGETGGHWCYANPPTNGGHRQFIDENTYDDFIALLGCATFRSAFESYCPNCENNKSKGCPFPKADIRTLEICSDFKLLPEFVRK